MSESRVRGGCLCGTVKFEIDPPFQKMVHCHCSRCRKGTGTGHATNLMAAAGQLHWLSGEDAISRYQLPGAKRFGKWFCRHCGSPLPRLTPDGKTTVVPAGSIDDSPSIAPTDRIFWSSRAPWSCSDESLPRHAEYPESW